MLSWLSLSTIHQLYMQPRGKNTALCFHALTPDRQHCLNWSNRENRGRSTFARDTHTFTEPWAVSNFSGGVTSWVPLKGKYFVGLINLAVITKLTLSSEFIRGLRLFTLQR